MKQAVWACIAILLALPAYAAEIADYPYAYADGGLQLAPAEAAHGKLTVGGEILARYEAWNWFSAPGDQSSYQYGWQRTRVHAQYTSDHLVALVQPQYVHMFGIPDDAMSPAPRAALGMGGLYWGHNGQENPGAAGIRQASITLRETPQAGWSLQAGRFDYADGLEALRPADGKKFNMLKNMRLSDRLISSFAWSAFGRSFDGGVGRWRNAAADVTAAYLLPTQGGWEKDAYRTMDDIRIAAATVTAARGTLLPGTELAAFYYNYRDDRAVTQRVDNVAATAAAVDLNVSMAGARLLGVYDLGPGQADLLLWGGWQYGDWYELDHEAYAVDAEIGYQFTQAPWLPWLRAGYFRGSGDDNAADGEHGTFFQMAPGTRKFELLPFCDLQNTEDIFAQVIVKPTPALTVRAEYHNLRLTEENDRWYMGSGPTQNSGTLFGYLARPAGGADELAQEIDAIVTYAVNDQLSVEASYSRVLGDDVVRQIYGDDEDADYTSLEVVFKF